MKPRVAVIGAGPAGLSTALTLTQNDDQIDVYLFEKGRNAKARTCPIDRGLVCDGCKGICNVISGFGGSMHYGDSIKVSGYPAGRRLRELLKADDYANLERAALQFFGLQNSDLVLSQIGEFHGRKLRQYPIAEIDSVRLASIIDQAISTLSFRGAVVHKRAIVNSVDTDADHFIVSYATQGKKHTLECDVVVFATGRAGFAKTDLIFEHLGVRRTLPQLSVGVRIEMSSSLLTPLSDAHKDFKFTENFDGLKVKSFCFSNSKDQGGRLKFCHYQSEFDHDVIFLDGHSNVGHQDSSSNPLAKGNFALLVQLPSKYGLEWLRNDFVSLYHELSGGKPIFQSARSFLSRPGPDPELTTSVRDCTHGDVAALFPYAAVKSLKLAVSEVCRTIASANSCDLDQVVSQTVLIAPDVEFFWPTVDVSPYFETNVRNLYVVGDTAGYAQGNLQACISGIAAAKKVKESV